MRVRTISDVAVDLHLEPANQVTTEQFSLKVDGLPPEQADSIRRRLTPILQQRWGTPAAAAPEHADAQAPKPRPAGRIRVGLGEGPSTDPARQRELQDVLRAVVAEELRNHQAARAASVCVCASGVPGWPIALTTPWWVNGVWTPSPSGPVWTIAVRLGPGSNWAILTLRDGATFSPPIPQSQALVGLANSTSWAKEISAFNLCNGRIGSVAQGGTNSTPRRMLLDRANCGTGADTIVFHKPGFLGIWHDVGHYVPADFWPAFGGTWGDYDWIID